MRRSLLPLVLLAAGCAAVEQPEPLRLNTNEPFALGMPGAVMAGVYSKDTITDVRCEGATCKESRGRWYATPHATTFDLHIDAVSEDGSPLRYDGQQTAIEITWWIRSSGAAPDVAVLPGAKHRFYVSPNEDVIWNQQGGTIASTGSFTASDDYQQDTCFSTDVTATEPGSGTVTFTLAERSVEVPFECASPTSVSDVALAPFKVDAQPPHAPELEAAATKAVLLDAGEEKTFWVTFTTKDGAIGVGGADRALPAPAAVFDLVPPNADIDASERLTLVGKRTGHSVLILRVGDVTSEIVVEVR